MKIYRVNDYNSDYLHHVAPTRRAFFPDAAKILFCILRIIQFAVGCAIGFGGGLLIRYLFNLF